MFARGGRNEIPSVILMEEFWVSSLGKMSLLYAQYIWREMVISLKCCPSFRWGVETLCIV